MEPSIDNNDLIPGNWKDKCILVVDDIETNYELFRILLKKLNVIKTIWAVNGLEAVNICKTNQHIDLVLMDIRMPVMDGYEATAKIKEFNKNMPVVIAHSAYVEEEHKDKCFAAGCTDYMSKPVHFDKLKEILLKHLI
jgi:two-component system, cell cycle response regulator DivK